MAEFVHLHVHSHYTLLESTITVPGLLAAVASKGMHTVALTDRGNLFGAFELYGAAKDLRHRAKEAAEALEKARPDPAQAARIGDLEAALAKAKRHAVRPIIGCQVNVAPLGIANRGMKDWSQLVLLACDEVGYRNLAKLVSRGWTEGFYYEPRIDLEMIAQHAAGLVCLTGAGQNGHLNRHLQVGAHEEAARQLDRLKQLFGERLFVELCDWGHDDKVDVQGLLRSNLDLARHCGVRPVATNWVHYLEREGAAIHEVQLAARDATTLADPRRRRMPSDQFWLKTPDEMAALFAACPEAVANSLAVAEICAGSGIPSGGYHLPRFPCGEGETEASLLRRLCEQGLRRRYGEAPGPELRERLDFELATIEKMGFPAYFLIVADFINWAKGQGIPVGPGRGSAAGSLVAYCMGITEMCPIRYGLLFERFLNPGRKSMPDIDIDFCKDRRDEVIRYVAQKYGQDAVTQIMTLGTMKARMAIKDVARAHEWTPEEAQELANLVPHDPSGKIDLKVCLGRKPLDEKKNEFAPVEAMLRRYEQDTRTRTVLDAALQLERLGRSLGVHACGMVVAPGPVSDYLPVCTVKEKPATQFNMTQVEKCGLLKMDFLGLKTMSILKKAIDIVAAGGGPRLVLEEIPLDDPTTFALLGTGRTLGVFQCESTGFQELIRRLKPDRFEDMIALVALYRPGPLGANMHNDYCDRKHGRQKVDYPHPVLEGVLKETYGLYIYQEQVMSLSRELCGFTPAQADDLRKAMGKKDLKTLEKLKSDFVEGAWRLHQFPKDRCEAMWNNILGFASYCFNKSHSACYGLIAYWTAWMKANHYGAFMTANLIYEMGDKEKMTRFVEELGEQGIRVLPPDLNESAWDFGFVPGGALPPQVPPTSQEPAHSNREPGMVAEGSTDWNVTPPGSGGGPGGAQPTQSEKRTDWNVTAPGSGGGPGGAQPTQSEKRTDWNVTAPGLGGGLGGAQPTQSGKGVVRFGFGGVKGIGEGAAETLVQERSRRGPFKSLFDLCERVDMRVINKRVVEALVKVGAFDSLHPNRRSLFETMERAFDHGHKLARNRESRQATMFDLFEQDSAYLRQAQGYAEVDDWSMTERLAGEKQLTGWWISAHPAAVDARARNRWTNHRAIGLYQAATGMPVAVAAVITGKRVVRTKTGRTMAILQLEDETGRFEAVLFPGRPNRRGEFEPGPFEKYGEVCHDDLVALFCGTVERRQRQAPQRPAPREELEETEVPGEDDEGDSTMPSPAPAAEVQETPPSLLLQEVIPLDQAEERLASEVVVAVDGEALPTGALDASEALVREFSEQGSCPLAFQIHTGGEAVISLNADPAFQVRPCRAFLDRMAAIWGADRILLRTRDPARSLPATTPR